MSVTVLNAFSYSQGFSCALSRSLFPPSLSSLCRLRLTRRLFLHLRDFINSVGPDPSRPGQGLALQIEAALHLPFQTDLYSDDVELSELPTTIHFFASPGNSQSHDPNKLIYAWGSFLTCVDPDGFLHLILRAHEVDW